MRGRRFYGGGSGFLLCFAAERKRCAPESLLQLPLPSHTLLWEKDTVQHNGNRAVTAFLFPRRFCGKRRLCDRIFALFGIVHCIAFRQKRNAMRPEVAAVLSNNLHVFAGRRLCVAGVFTAEGLDFCFALRQKGNVVRPEACSNCRPRLTRFCGKRGCATGFLHCLALCTALLSARSAMPCAQKFAAVLLTVSCAFSERATPKGRFTPEICRISLRTFREAPSRKGQGYGMNAAAVPCASRRRDFRKGGTF